MKIFSFQPTCYYGTWAYVVANSVEEAKIKLKHKEIEKYNGSEYKNYSVADMIAENEYIIGEQSIDTVIFAEIN